MPAIHEGRERPGKAEDAGLLINFVYVAQILISLLTILGKGAGVCPGCAETQLDAYVALTGFLFYSTALTLRAGVWPRVNRVVSPLAATVHSTLIAELAVRGKACWPCILSFGLAILLLLLEARRLGLLRFLGVVAACLAGGAVSWSTRPYLAIEDRVLFSTSHVDRLVAESRFVADKINLIILVRSQCPHCESFKSIYEPQLLRDYPERLAFTYIPLKTNPRGPTVPLIIIGRARKESIYVEGLPPYAVVRRGIGRFMNE